MTRPGPKPKPIEHGTYGGYNMHRRRGVEMCDACERACKQYRKDWRKQRAQARVRGRRREAVEVRALRRLGAEHPQRLTQLLREELARG